MGAINRVELLLCSTLRFVADLQLVLSITCDSLGRNGSSYCAVCRWNWLSISIKEIEIFVILRRTNISLYKEHAFLFESVMRTSEHAMGIIFTNSHVMFWRSPGCFACRLYSWLATALQASINPLVTFDCYKLKSICVPNLAICYIQPLYLQQKY